MLSTCAEISSRRLSGTPIESKQLHQMRRYQGNCSLQNLSNSSRPALGLVQRLSEMVHFYQGRHSEESILYPEYLVSTAFVPIVQLRQIDSS